MKPGALLAALTLWLTFTSSPAHACPLCLGGTFFGPGQQLDVADQAVLAAPVAGTRQWRVTEAVKGPGIAGRLVAESIDGAAGQATGDDAMRASRPLLLLVRHEQWPGWSSLGPIGAEYAGWLRQLVATGPNPHRPDVDWRARVAVVAPYLEDRESLAAEIAYGELARAPYGAIRSLKPRLDAAAIAGWLDDPRLVARHPAYTLLLGIAGGPADAERLERRLDAAWTSRDATNLGAMLAADLELRGPSRVAWVETRYLADRRRTMPEIAAAVQALGEHGDVSGAVPRARVIQAYLLLIRERIPLAGLVAEHLADWEYWDAVTHFAELLRSNARMDPASRAAIVGYLERCPRAEAKAALASLRVGPPVSQPSALAPPGARSPEARAPVQAEGADVAPSRK